MSSPGPVNRYHRQQLLPQVGDVGQERLARARVLVVGVGALGCTSADLLARAGVGTLHLLDRDLVEFTNLQRQTLFDEADAASATPKAAAAAARLSRVNSQIGIVPLVRDLTATIAEQTLAQVQPDILIDGTDNFETRYLLNDLSVKHAIPYAYAGVVGTAGMSALFTPPGPCLRCVFPEPAAPGATPTCDIAGVLGPAVAVVAALQAAAVIRLLISGSPQEWRTTLNDVDAWTGRSRSLDLSEAKRPDCPCCGRRQFEVLSSTISDHASLCGQNAVQVTPPAPASLDLPAIASRLAAHGQTTSGRLHVRCVLPDGLELTVFPDARAIIRGTTRPEVARSLYSRLLGG
ncbi:MAG TPA: ThiF family adenylyltransferase [Phycisphaerales bacterium]|nr:ThiF family adenylyltransferase [Phycisphaerales bacterium]